MAFNTDNENALRQIRDIALRWQECDCMGAWASLAVKE
jgi:hypothetical protein